MQSWEYYFETLKHLEKFDVPTSKTLVEIYYKNYIVVASRVTERLKI